jgi:hypothetical protein
MKTARSGKRDSAASFESLKKPKCRFEILTAVVIKSSIFWDIILFYYLFIPFLAPTGAWCIYETFRFTSVS